MIELLILTEYNILFLNFKFVFIILHKRASLYIIIRKVGEPFSTKVKHKKIKMTTEELLQKVVSTDLNFIKIYPLFFYT